MHVPFSGRSIIHAGLLSLFCLFFLLATCAQASSEGGLKANTLSGQSRLLEQAEASGATASLGAKARVPFMSQSDLAASLKEFTLSSAAPLVSPPAVEKNKFSPIEYFGHKLDFKNKKHRDIEGQTCFICLEVLGKESAIAKLPCLHFYDQVCAARLTGSQKECPECRNSFTMGQARVFQNVTALAHSLPMVCVNDDCLIDETLEELQGKADDVDNGVQSCPYPIKVLENSPAKHFLGNNAYFIMSWLEEQCEKKGYQLTQNVYLKKLRTYSGGHWGKAELLEYPAIFIKLNRGGHSARSETLYFSARQIENHSNGRECFLSLVRVLRTDLLISSLRETYPNMFNSKSDVYINSYDIWYDKLYIVSNGVQFTPKLTLIWNPEKKFFNFTRLRELMGTFHLDYASLFKGPVRRTGSSYSPRSGSFTGVTDGYWKNLPPGVGVMGCGPACPSGIMAKELDVQEASDKEGGAPPPEGFLDLDWLP